jgi:hypothetical protein
MNDYKNIYLNTTNKKELDLKELIYILGSNLWTYGGICKQQMVRQYIDNKKQRGNNGPIQK